MKFSTYDREKDSSELPTFDFEDRIDAPELYIPSPGLVNAVNVAITLGLPLLLTGEPGTGKTQLAYHLADYFNIGEPIRFNTKTTSSATDLFYSYDALKHFQYSHQNDNKELIDEVPNLSHDEIVERKFIRYQALGKAIKIASEQSKRSIVLIDEIDKAPRDLPNDILAALEKLEFEVPEVNKVEDNRIIASKQFRPIIILTSNSEKNLPDAFLRRCIYYHIEFPGQEELKEILQKKVIEVDDHSLEILLTHFDKARNLCNIKKPTTSELLLWVMYLEKQNFNFSSLEDTSTLSSEEKEQLVSSYSILAKNQEDFNTLIEEVSISIN